MAVFGVLLTGGVMMLDLGPDTALLMVLMCVGAGAGMVADVATCALQGVHRLGRAAIASSIVQLAAQGAIVAVLLRGGGLVGLVTVTTAAMALSAVVAVRFFVSRFGWTWSWSAREALNISRQGIPFLTWQLGLLFYGSIDFVILPALTNSGVAGNYIFAYRLASVPIFVATIVVGSVFPILAASISDEPWFRVVLTRSAAITIAATLPIATGAAILAPWITRIVGGDHEFDRAVPLIAILSLHIPLAAVDTVLGSAALARDKQRTLAKMAWVAAVCNPLANFVAIPLSDDSSNGAIGASAVTVGQDNCRSRTPTNDEGMAFLGCAGCQHDQSVHRDRIHGGYRGHTCASCLAIIRRNWWGNSYGLWRSLSEWSPQMTFATCVRQFGGDNLRAAADLCSTKR